MSSRAARIAVIWVLALVTLWLGERFYRNYLWQAEPPRTMRVVDLPD